MHMHPVSLKATGKKDQPLITNLGLRSQRNFPEPAHTATEPSHETLPVTMTSGSPPLQSLKITCTVLRHHSTCHLYSIYYNNSLHHFYSRYKPHITFYGVHNY